MKNHTQQLLKVFAILSIAVYLGSLNLVHGAAVSQDLTFTPAADSYVDSSSPSTNHGTETQIRVDGSPTVNSYLRFNVTGVSGAVTSATLRIYANSAQSTGFAVHAVSGTTWGETTINYSNAPALHPTVIGFLGR